jgi:hypothetical protein
MPSRRQFVTATGATAALLGTRSSWAGVDRVSLAVQRARARWSQRVEELLSVELAGEQESDAATEQARGLFALQAHEAMATLPIEDQCHPDAQALMHEAAEALGGSVQATRARLEAWLEGDGAADPAIAALALQARGLGRRTAQSDLDGHSARAVQRAMRQLERDPDGLRREVRRGLRRLQRLEARAARLATSPESLHSEVDDETRRRVAIGRARHATPTGLVGGVLGLIGILLLGLVVLGGLVVALLGLILNTALGLGIVFMVVGLALIVLGIIGIAAIAGG